MQEKLRWKQRYESFDRALKQLQAAIQKRNWSQLERAGVVQTFEFTWELAWLTLQDFLRHQGDETKGPRDVLKKAFERELIGHDETWLDILDARNTMAHVYDEDQSLKIAKLIRDKYFPLLAGLRETLTREL